jgi:hypothetical protein
LDSLVLKIQALNSSASNALLVPKARSTVGVANVVLKYYSQPTTVRHHDAARDHTARERSGAFGGAAAENVSISWRSERGPR